MLSSEDSAFDIDDFFNESNQNENLFFLELIENNTNDDNIKKRLHIDSCSSEISGEEQGNKISVTSNYINSSLQDNSLFTHSVKSTQPQQVDENHISIFLEKLKKSLIDLSNLEYNDTNRLENNLKLIQLIQLKQELTEKIVAFKCQK